MRRLIYFIFASVAVLVFVQCSDWTEMENKFTEPVNINSEDYYRALREYKKTDHPICFGWYSDWSGTGDDMNNQLRGIPDSMDLVSLWGGAFNLTEAQKSDLKEVREKKGTRILYCQHFCKTSIAFGPWIANCAMRSEAFSNSAPAVLWLTHQFQSFSILAAFTTNKYFSGS